MRPSKDGSVVVCYYQDWVKAQCQERGEKGERKGEGEREKVGGTPFPEILIEKQKTKISHIMLMIICYCI